MADYIEREQVKDELLSWAVCIKHPEHLMREDALHVIDSIPAADVVPVVRCRDCKHWEKGDFMGGDTPDSLEYGGRCPLVRFARYESDFCSYGERKDGDG